MFKKSNKEPQLDVFASVANILENSALKNYSDQKHWHNQFREQIVNRMDEYIFSVLFTDNMGAPNAPVRILVGMMILKESFGWSDSQLFEQCYYNLLVRSALGLFNINDPLPVESTYYLFRKRIYDYSKQSGEDLMKKVFENITKQQFKEFEVNGHSIRMDSKLIGSNIALFSRYEIINHTLCMFYKSLDKDSILMLLESDKNQLEELAKEEPSKTIYHSTKEEIKGRLVPMGLLIYKILKLYGHFQTDQFQLLQRVFSEQYKVSEDQQVELRPKEEISSSSVQSPHDPDCSYRNKDNQKVKGFSVNITETCSDDNLNLITSVIVEKANTSDSAFVESAIESTREVTSQIIEKAYLDGAYQSPENDNACENIDMVFTGIQGCDPRYDLNMAPEGLIVTDTQTGEQIKAVLARKKNSNQEDKWCIKTSSGYRYFDAGSIRTSYLRRNLLNRTPQELNKRCNVEATIFQYAFTLKNKKSKYRGIIKQRIWTVCRCLWINLVRIINFLKQTCQRTAVTIKNTKLQEFLRANFSYQINIKQTLSLKILFALFTLLITNFLVLL